VAEQLVCERLIRAAKDLGRKASRLHFALPVSHVYNPLDYAWSAHELYLRKFATGQRRVLFLGMNPGPFGMVQTGVPFGEVAAVRDWLGIETRVKPPRHEHPRRPIDGFSCTRSEVSGQRLWGLFARRFKSPEKFFAHHFVLNYCPLAFLEESGRNRTPDKLVPAERDALMKLCDSHLLEAVEVLRPEWLIGIGAYAAGRAREVCEGQAVRVGQILHPSPASPAANKDWAGAVTKQICELAIWDAHSA
jgi:single-strand selective monofunctional uracil DNA glycosylase